MSQEVDPEKILAEFEAARLAARSRSRHPAPGRPPVALIATLGVLLFAVIALWILSGILGGMGKPDRQPKPRATPAPAAPSGSRSATAREPPLLFCEVSPLPRLAEVPKIPIT